MRAMRSALRKPRVSSLSTRLIDTTSALRQQRVDVDHRHGASARGVRFQAITSMPMPRADARHLAADAAEPDHAQRLAESCMPSCGVQMPARISRSMRATSRAAANISAIVCSATAVSP